MRAKLPLLIGGAVIVLALSMLAAVFWGTADLPWDERIRALLRQPDAPRNLQLIIWEWRVPRVLLVAMLGAGLALAGMVMQALLRNPLADPYLLGLSSGASAAAVAAIVWLPAAVTAVLGVPLIAFVGAFVAFAITLGLSVQPGRGMDRLVVILAGVAVSLFFQSITAFFLHIADPHVTQEALGWLMGTAAGTAWPDLVPMAIVLPFSIVLVFICAPLLDAVLLGDERAVALGVPLALFRVGMFALVALITGIGVAAAGIVGFVGLVVPHMARLLVGAAHRRLMPLTLLLGAIVLVVVDLLCRVVLAPRELPLAVLLAVFAAPPFIYILRMARRAS